jgi:hypothetical protein
MDDKNKKLFSLAQEAEFNFNDKNYQQRLVSNFQNFINDVLFQLSFKFQLRCSNKGELTECCTIFPLFGLFHSRDAYIQNQQKTNKQKIFEWIRHMGDVSDRLRGKLDIDKTDDMISSLTEFKVLFLM